MTENHFSIFKDAQRYPKQMDFDFIVGQNSFSLTTAEGQATTDPKIVHNVAGGNTSNTNGGRRISITSKSVKWQTGS